MYGFDVLTLVPFDRRLIDVGLLSPAEQAWIDAYHRRVEDTVAPLLDEPDRQWLAQACAPLIAS